VEQLLEQYSSDSSSSSSGTTDEYSMLLHNYRLAMALEFSFFDACGEEAGLQGDPAALEVNAVIVNCLLLCDFHVCLFNPNAVSAASREATAKSICMLQLG
jgi:hypothetical protein